MLVPEDNGKQNPKSLTQTNIKNILPAVMAINQCVLRIRFSKPFKTYLGKDAVHNFGNNIKKLGKMKESKYFSEVIKKLLTKNL